MRQTVAVLFALGIGFGAGYWIGDLDQVDTAPSMNAEDDKTRATPDPVQMAALDPLHPPPAPPLTARTDAPHEGDLTGSEPTGERGEQREATTGRDGEDPVTPTARPPSTRAVGPSLGAADSDGAPVRPSSGPPQANPELRDQVRDAFREVRGSLAECYLLLLSLEPDAEDQLVFMLLVEAHPDEPESSVVTLEGIRSSQLEIDDVSCFADVVDEFDFPPPLGGQDSYRITYPVNLSAN